MTVFEELVDELKVDNLIDERIPERAIREPRDNGPADRAPAVDHEDAIRYKQRAEDDFGTIQLIEHLFDGVESEPVKSDAALAFAADARRALGRIRQLSEDAGDEYIQARKELTRALDGWTEQLELRDGHIDPSRLRSFCENSHPPLSAKSLIALAGLYRRAEFSDQVRDKFDFVMTRLFTYEPNSVKREMRFGRGEAIEQINKLYQKWSIRHDTAGTERDQINETVEKFTSFSARVAAAPTFADLFRSDLPAAIREFKKSLGPTIFEPLILAAMMDCNVTIGNRFVEIAAVEKESYGPEAVRSKYGDAYDQIATDAAARTLQLSTLLENEDLKPEETSVPIEIMAGEVAVENEKKSRTGRFKFLGGVNKLLLAAAILTVIGGTAAFFLIEADSLKRADIPAAKPAEIGTSPLAKYFSSARTTESTFYVTTTPDWEGLTPDEKKKILRSALDEAKKKGMRNVRVQSPTGTRLAFASDNRVEIDQ